ncbi:hypothetical protein KP509_01G087800 [Ceratopteris richardii]|uniref:Uncharacterized protein n=1 Tax=Ceratopteris richardii TaxID=49495 RepID=A0A8T2VN97_CERRI|nr:hypothetical protein KP509_01G087800 [Ceratopteris richardii]
MALEAFIFGAPVVAAMLGVPMWHSISECRRGSGRQFFLLRWWLVCALIILMSLIAGLVFGVSGFFFSDASPSSSPRTFQMSSNCKILSSSVDLRWSKICLPRSLSPSEDSIKMRSKFRCYFEYYWASVFKVEFKPSSSDTPIKAVSEVPKAALPSYCRPGFGSVWTLKEKYQVNGTFPCKYTPGHLVLVDIADDLFIRCQSEKVTPFNFFKQACMGLLLLEEWVFSSQNQPGNAFRKVLGYISVAACFSMLVAGFSRMICRIHFMLHGPEGFSSIEMLYLEVRVQFTCILLICTLWASWYNGHMEDLVFFIRQLLVRFR